ncbi:MAG: ATPase, T2SS/T4P/T4SS family [Rhizobiaceae bacterium]
MVESHSLRKVAFIEKALKAKDTIEIAINTDGGVWIERVGSHHMEFLMQMDKPSDLITIMASLAGQGGEQEGVKKPIISTHMPFGDDDIRLQLVGHKVVDQNAAMTFRLQPKVSYTLDDFPMLYDEHMIGNTVRARKLEDLQSVLDKKGMQAALKFAVLKKMNILISGGTSTAKTSLLRTLLLEASEHDRIITIEDAFEIRPEHKNKIMLRASREPTDKNSYAALLVAVLRLRPDRIIVGELRGTEAMTFLKAIRSGHGGSMTSIHAESTSIALSNLCIMVAETGTTIPYDMIEKIVKESIDIVVQLDRTDAGVRGIEGIDFVGLQQ